MSTFFTNLRAHVSSRRNAAAHGAPAAVVFAAALALTCCGKGEGRAAEGGAGQADPRSLYSDLALKIATKPDLWVDGAELRGRYPKDFLDLLAHETAQMLAMDAHGYGGQNRGAYLLEKTRLVAPIEMWQLDADKLRVSQSDSTALRRIYKRGFASEAGSHWLVPVMMDGAPTDAVSVDLGERGKPVGGSRYDWHEGAALRKTLLERRANGARLAIVICTIGVDEIADYWIVLDGSGGRVRVDCYTMRDPPEAEPVGMQEMIAACVEAARRWSGEEAAPSTESPDRVRDKLSRLDIVNAMKSIELTVRKCFAGESRRSSVMVQVTIAPSGSVSSATTTGWWADTPAGQCAARAVRDARFPQSLSPMSITFPFEAYTAE